MGKGLAVRQGPGEFERRQRPERTPAFTERKAGRAVHRTLLLHSADAVRGRGQQGRERGTEVLASGV